MPDNDPLHEILLRTGGLSNRFQSFTPFEPLTVDEFRSLSQSDFLIGMPDKTLERLWLVPVQRWLQQQYRIDQRSYTTGTIPSLAELEEDFQVAAVICIDKFSRNEEEQVGEVRTEGASVRWSHEIPPRAQQLLERFERTGGRHGRA